MSTEKEHILLKFIIPFISMSMTITGSAVFADIGSKHQDIHKRDKNSVDRQQKAEPFDFSTIIDEVENLHPSAIDSNLGGHVSQEELESLPSFQAYVEAFLEGDELFEINYNALDGVGVNVGNGKRFSSIPRLDLDGPMAWANVLPHRITGPNSDSCISCHNVPVADGAGGVNDNVIRIDPERIQRGMIERQTPHVFGLGALQLLAEEMTTELQTVRDVAVASSCASGNRNSVELIAKDIHFGSINVSCDSISYRRLEGIDRDLIVKPYEWKGLTAFVRDFVRGASHQELGMQATELVGDADSDFDGISNELSVGDITALTIYNAAQPRPVSKLELNDIVSELTEEELFRYGLPLTSAEIESINSGEILFESAQCSSCHTPVLTVSSPIYSEPSKHPEYRDTVFPAGESVSLPTVAIEFDITRDILDNAIVMSSGQTLGQFERNSAGAAKIKLYGDLKRHDMGKSLAEEIDEGNVGSSVFMTENLWGVGSTAPYLHDGRATTLTEAILYHGGKARQSKSLFVELSNAEKADLIAFLNNLALYLAP